MNIKTIKKAIDKITYKRKNRALEAVPAMTFTKQGAQFVSIGGGFSYEMTSTNTGSENLTSWEISDTFPTTLNALRVSFTNGSSPSYNISIRTTDSPGVDKQIIVGATAPVNSFDLALYTPPGERVISLKASAASFAAAAAPPNLLFITGAVNTSGVVGQNIINTAQNTAVSSVGIIAKSSSFTSNIFGYNQSSIGEFVWIDANANGMYDVGEIGLNGVKVELYNAAGTSILDTVITGNYGDFPGYYNFSRLLPGKYLVKFTAPNGYILTSQNLVFNGSTPNPATGFTNEITLGANVFNNYVNAGLIASASSEIGSFVWNDINENGLYEPEEPGINGVTVQLLASDKTEVLATTVTANSMSNTPGFYKFSKLQEGAYYTKFLPAPGYSITTQNLVPNGSTPDPVTGITERINLGAGEVNSSVNAGVLAPCAPPVIITTVYCVKKDSIYDPMQGVSAFDCAEKNITADVLVTENTVNTAVPGKYTVSYEVTDKRGSKTTKKVTVTVYAPTPIDQAVTDILQSVALQQAALSHIINAEGEKIQKILQITNNKEQITAVNSSVSKTLNSITNLEIVLQQKLTLLKKRPCS
ncbi:MAG: SdrD B-like domain-containing protein [Clostridia bacterium]